MALFIEASGNYDILTTRAVRRMLDEWRQQLTTRLTYLAPGQETRLFTELRERLLGELAIEEGLAARVAELELLASAGYENELADACRRFTLLAGDYFRQRRSVLAIHALCNGFRDQLLARAFALTEDLLLLDGHGRPPAPYALLATGAPGRLEQSLTGGNDYFLVHGGSGGCAGYFSRFAVHLMALLRECGLVIFVRHPLLGEHLWQGSLAEWQALVEQELRRGEPKFRLHLPAIPGLTGPPFGEPPELEEYTRMVELLCDLRPVCGDETLAATMLEHARTVLAREEATEGYRQLARKIAAMPVALGLFGWFRVARSGEHRGEFSLEEMALAPLVMTVRLCARQWRVGAPSTVARIKGLFAAGRIGVELADRLLLAYHEFAGHKIDMEIGQSLNGGKFYFNPDELSATAAERFKDGLEAVVSLQKLFYQGLAEAG
jgi:CBS domain-containing protein